MHKLIIIAVSTVAVVATAVALRVAASNNRPSRSSSPSVNTKNASPSSPSLSQDQAGESMPSNQTPSSNNISISNTNISSSTNFKSEQSTSVSAVSITVSSDQTSNQNLSINRGTDVSLKIFVIGSNSLKFSSSNGAVNFGVIVPGSSESVNFKATDSFTIQPQLPNGTNQGPAISIHVD